MNLILEALRPLSPAAPGAGLVLILGALIWLVILEARRPGEGVSEGVSLGTDGPVDGGAAWTWLVPLGLAIAAGTALRLYDLDAKSLTHPEVYTPGIALPAGIAEPPPRLGFVETVTWHFHFEPHPQGYYLAMWLWTKLFGTDLGTMRLASALLGSASVLLVFAVASLAFNRTVGWVAAAMVAFHGFHIYWSQIARMYVPGCFLGLLATWLLLELSSARRPRGGLEAAYVATIVAGVSTQYFFGFSWPPICSGVF